MVKEEGSRGQISLLVFVHLLVFCVILGNSVHLVSVYSFVNESLPWGETVADKA